MYLNRRTIAKINKLKEIVKKSNLFLAQNNSRYNGNFLNSLRIYNDEKNKGKKSLAIETLTTEKEIDRYILNHSE